jgi:hypothetical protein
MTVDQNEEFAGGINRAEMCLNLTPSLRWPTEPFAMIEMFYICTGKMIANSYIELWAHERNVSRIAEELYF